MIYGEKNVEKPIRWAMVGGGKGSQIGYIHRSAALRDFNFELVAGALDVDPVRGKQFGENPARCARALLSGLQNPVCGRSQAPGRYPGGFHRNPKFHSF